VQLPAHLIGTTEAHARSIVWHLLLALAMDGVAALRHDWNMPVRGAPVTIRRRTRPLFGSRIHIHIHTHPHKYCVLCAYLYVHIIRGTQDIEARREALPANSTGSKSGTVPDTTHSRRAAPRVTVPDRETTDKHPSIPASTQVFALHGLPQVPSACSRPPPLASLLPLLRLPPSYPKAPSCPPAGSPFPIFEDHRYRNCSCRNLAFPAWRWSLNSLHSGQYDREPLVFWEGSVIDLRPAFIRSAGC
jgi:hypothetical protein